MGIITDPGYDLIGDYCQVCWAEGEAPKKLYLDVGGIIKSPIWIPEAGDVLQGRFVLEYVSPCTYDWLGPNNAFVRLVFVPFITRLYITSDNGTPSFQSYVYIQCCSWFSNDFDCASYYFCGGFAAWAQREEDLVMPSIRSAMAALNIESGKKVFAEVYPTEDGHRVFRIADRKEGTCVKIKI